MQLCCWASPPEETRRLALGWVAASAARPDGAQPLRLVAARPPLHPPLAGVAATPLHIQETLLVATELLQGSRQGPILAR